MTELIEAPQAVKAINHWIGGSRRAGESGRTGRVFDPATGAETGAGRLRLGRGDRRRRPGREAGVPGLARALALAPLGALLPDPPALRRAPRGPRAAPHRRARQGALRRPRRGRARARGDRVLLRDARPCSRAATPSRSRAASTSTRSASRSASSPGSRRSTSPRWCRCGCGRPRSPAATPSSSSRPRRTRPPRCSTAELLAEAGVPGGRLQRRHGDKVAVDSLHRPSRRRRRSRSSARRRSPSTSTRRRPRPASAARRSAARRTT